MITPTAVVNVVGMVIVAGRVPNTPTVADVQFAAPKAVSKWRSVAVVPLDCTAMK